MIIAMKVIQGVLSVDNLFTRNLFCPYQWDFFTFNRNKNDIFAAAPSEVTRPTIVTTGDNNATITWAGPDRNNGILTYYKVTIFNELRNYTEIITLSPNDTKYVKFYTLGM